MDSSRVSVGTIQDWRRLEDNYKDTTLSHLEEEVLVKGLTKEKDALIVHITHFIDRTFKVARPNLRINGQNYETLDQHGQNIEPFDEALDRRIWSLADTRLQWQKRLAQTRREVPADIGNTLLELLRQQVVGTEGLVDFIEEKDDKTLGLENQLEAFPQIEDGFQNILNVGDELEQTIPSQIERTDMVRNATTEVKGWKS